MLVNLRDGDFEFVEKLAFRNADDKFSQPAPLPFSLPKGPRSGPEATLETSSIPGLWPPATINSLLRRATANRTKYLSRFCRRRPKSQICR